MAKTMSETKGKSIIVGFTPTFKERVISAAKHAGITPTEFVRNAVIEKMERLNGKRKP